MVRRLTAALVVALAFALAGSVSLVPVTAAYADPPSAHIRDSIAKAAISQIGKKETGNNYYPKAYKISSAILRPAAWCGIFANWAWWKGGATKRPNMTGSGTNQGHWATYWQKWGKAQHRWKPISKKSTAPGDVVVYGNYPDSRHVGVVVGVKYDSHGNVSQVRTVEGNFGDKVTDRGWRKIGSMSGGGAKATGFVSPV
ncbi:C40 family peptidase [Fodinicola acaciae]|uniref:C40 family peptidase n=1 Tax=Fodinicola acaciae TaxID=2681555 RepID=UPI0013D8D0F0|nr:C40 family peptidase [Fodinicola acaciae]